MADVSDSVAFPLKYETILAELEMNTVHIEIPSDTYTTYALSLKPPGAVASMLCSPWPWNMLALVLKD